MIYPGDIKNIVLSITKTDGTQPSVTLAPIVSVVRLVDQTAVVNAQPMTQVNGSQVVYFYTWDTTGAQEGDYIALVSYASDGVSVSSRMLDSFRLGDSRVTGVVALNSTVAKDATVAKDSSVAHFTDLATVSPDASPVVLAIKAKTDNLPADPASLSILNAVAQNLQDLHDYELGTWTIDKNQNPQILTILRPNGGVLARFQLTDSNSTTNRTPSL